MRIIAGKFKGRKLATIKGDDIRPTSDRVKGAVFSILRERVIDADFLDLCAGTGNMGLEALSRGAKSATFIDRNHHCLRLIESNLERCGLHRKHSQVRLIKQEAQKGLALFGNKETKFELIYFDPPYDSKIHELCLHLIAEKQILSQSGLIVVEHRKMKRLDCSLPPTINKLMLMRQSEYGDTVLSFYKWGIVMSTKAKLHGSVFG